MSLFKIPFLLSTIWGMHTTLTPPHPPPPSNEIVAPDGLKILAPLLKLGFWAAGLAEVAVILASRYPQIWTSQLVLRMLVHRPIDPKATLEMTYPFVLGWFFSLSGGIIRRQCYLTLGRYFTFELSIRKDHHLVTSGPYSIVRHPSYTGAAFAAIGGALSHLNHASWAVACSGLIPDSPIAFASLWLFAAIVAGSVIIPRLPKEDDMMRREFGEEWVRWARNVPFRLIPGVY
ncbi:hypothetical protein BDQ12DRAFT_688750 [Crucibulum laeve]|uniref:Protein-S-isoprenylcysteine O-methyltransferase n=1 Tax=Crucibulum laeve TaxID=68775 RepID=A0A5C3LPJ8_9AGAR|nr:hypothetical protein BDQ12DRAFT_688750 [Crucibulum laeve]